MEVRSKVQNPTRTQKIFKILKFFSNQPVNPKIRHIHKRRNPLISLGCSDFTSKLEIASENTSRYNPLQKNFLPLTLPLFFSRPNGIIQGKLCRNLSAERVLRLYLCKKKHQLHNIVLRKTALCRGPHQGQLHAAPRKIVLSGEPLQDRLPVSALHAAG